MSVQPNQEKEQLRQVLSAVVTALRQGLGDNLVAVVLFGSRARGDATEASDWDLLVIARHLPPSFFQRHLQLKALLPIEWRGRVALLARTPAEFEAHLTSLMLDIALDGVVLDDPEGYAAEQLARLRKLIESKGLHRKQKGKDFIWNWERFPGFDWSLEWEAVR
jgi:predicted nucleotidyltransferase